MSGDVVGPKKTSGKRKEVLKQHTIEEGHLHDMDERTNHAIASNIHQSLVGEGDDEVEFVSGSGTGGGRQSIAVNDPESVRPPGFES